MVKTNTILKFIFFFYSFCIVMYFVLFNCLMNLIFNKNLSFSVGTHLEILIFKLNHIEIMLTQISLKIVFKKLQLFYFFNLQEMNKISFSLNNY